MVVLLDIQSLAIAKASAAVVQSKVDDLGRPFFGSVVFKNANVCISQWDLGFPKYLWK